MKINKYLGFLLRDFFTIFGFAMTFAVVLLTLYSKDTTSTSLLWQIILAASACTLLKFGLVNNLEFGKKAQTAVFLICTTAADLFVIIWLLFFSPGKIDNIELLTAYIVVIVLAKGLGYVMISIDARHQAKLLNEKLAEHNIGEGK